MRRWRIERLGRRGDGVAIADDGTRALAALTLPGEVIEGEATPRTRHGPHRAPAHHRALAPARARVLPALPRLRRLLADAWQR